MPNSPQSTQWALRQALNAQLVASIISDVVPGINAGLSAYLTASDPATIPQFDATTVRNGDLIAFRGALICVVDAGCTWRKQGSGGLWYGEFSTRIRVKATDVADNQPEDFQVFHAIVGDNLTIYFLQQTKLIIQPQQAGTGAPLLPSGAAFTNCGWSGWKASPMPYKDGPTLTYIYGQEAVHTAGLSIQAAAV